MPHAVLRGPVEIGVEGNSRLLRGAQEREADRRGIDRIGDAERAAIAMIRIDQPLVVLAANEIGQNLTVAPALGACVRDPGVVVLGGAARIELGVDRGSAADDLGLRVPDDAAVQVLLRNCAPPPACDPLGHLREAGRHSEQGIPVGAASLKQKDLDRRIGAQTIGEDASGRPSADNDVIVRHRGKS